MTDVIHYPQIALAIYQVMHVYSFAKPAVIPMGTLHGSPPIVHPQEWSLYVAHSWARQGPCCTAVRTAKSDTLTVMIAQYSPCAPRGPVEGFCLVALVDTDNAG